MSERILKNKGLAFLFCALYSICITSIAAVGANPRYLEELVIGGGASDADGGAWMDKTGAAQFTGAVQTGPLTSTTGAFSSTVGVTGLATITGGAKIPDNAEAVYGTDSDYKFRFDSSTSRLQLRDPANNVLGYWYDSGTTGDLYATGSLNSLTHRFGTNFVATGSDAAGTNLDLRDASNNLLFRVTDGGSTGVATATGFSTNGGGNIDSYCNSSPYQLRLRVYAPSNTGTYIDLDPLVSGTADVMVRMFRSSTGTINNASLVVYEPNTSTARHTLNAKTGNYSLTGYVDSTGGYYVGGSKVVGSRGGSIADLNASQTTFADLAAATTSSNTTNAKINAIITALETHGLIAP